MLYKRMPKSSRQASRRGAPKKAPDGLNKALYMRVEGQLIEALEKLRERESHRRPGVVVSRADVARSILWAAVQKAEEDDEV